MSILENEKLKKILSLVIQDMHDFIEDDEDAEYTVADVDRCEKILKTFLKESAEKQDKTSFLKGVEKAVLALNELNAEVDETLIETDQREGICEYIITVGVIQGFNDENDDITEEWREW